VHWEGKVAGSWVTFNINAQTIWENKHFGKWQDYVKGADFVEGDVFK